MKVERANEILNSKGVIDVDYNGKSVWLKSVDQNNETVEVEIMNTPSQSQVVSVDDLHEA